MREIKFRILNSDGEWEYSGQTAFPWDIISGDCYSTRYKNDTEGQYTGLEDKNDKKIYEGDIVKVLIPNDDSLGNDDEYICEVVYGSGGKSVYVASYPASFSILNKEFYHDRALLWNNRHTNEVIGNIHENPELLEFK